MNERTRPEQEPASGGSTWDDLDQEPLLDPTEPLPLKRTFGRVLFGTLYDHLGMLILINVLVTVQTVLGAALGLAAGSVLRATGGFSFVVAAVLAGFVAAPAWAGLFNYVRLVCDIDMRPSFRDYGRGMRAFAVRSWLLLAVQATTGGLMALNLYFYSRLHSTIGSVLIILMLMLAALWAMAGLYAWPLLVRDQTWRMLLRNSFFLALAAPISTFAMLVSLVSLSAILVLTRVGVLILFFVVWAMTENVALQRLVRIFRARQHAGEDTAAPAADL